MIVNTKPKHITDADLLALMDSGEIVISKLNTASPVLIHRGRIIQPELTEQRGRQRIVGNVRHTWKIRRDGKARRIVRARLVWMYANRELIGDGFTIHHRDHDRHNDRIANLERMTYGQHAGHHGGYLD